MYTKTSELANEMKAHLLTEPKPLDIQKLGAVKWGELYECWQDKGVELDKQLVSAFIEESPNMTNEQKEALVSSTSALIEKYQSPGYATQYIIEAIEKLSQTKTN